MVWRWRKSKSLGGGARLNVGKKSASVSVGVPGLRVSIGTRGVHRTVSIPGTGLSQTKKLGTASRSTDATDTNEETELAPEPPKGLDLLGVFAIIVGLFGGGLCLVPVSIGYVVSGLAGLVAGVAVLAWGVARVVNVAAERDAAESVYDPRN